MRKALVFLLLASAAAPAFAAVDGDQQRVRKVERAERPQRVQRPQRVERAERAGSDESQAPREARGDGMRPQIVERRAARGGDGQADAPAGQTGDAPVARQRGDAPASVTNWRARERYNATSPTAVQERNRTGAQVLHDRIRRGEAPIVSRVPRAGTQPPPRTASRPAYSTQHWSGDWRSDDRYDWRDHRRRYSWLFNYGFYRDPFGWGYQPFSIGWRMWPSYYGSNYWLNDPWQYRLPYSPPGYRWIRYYDDALLVDTWDGQVVDVIRNFFW